MKKNNILIVIVFLTLISFFAVSFTEKTIDVDMFFSIKLGEETINNGFSTFDTLTYHENLRYVNVRYLYNILVYKIYNTYGFNGIYISTMICNVLNFNLIFFIISKLTKKNYNVSFVFTILSIALSWSFLYARTIHLSLTIFLIEFYAIRKIVETNQKRYYIVMFLLPILLVNIHGSLFLIFFVFYIPYVLEYLLSKFDKTKEIFMIKSVDFSNHKNLMILMIINFFEGLISPLGITPYILPFFVIFGKTTSYIIELKTIKAINLIFCLIAFLLNIIFSTDDEKFHDFFLAILLIILSLIMRRAFYYTTTIQMIVLATVFDNYIKNNETEILIKIKKNKNILIFILSLVVLIYGTWKVKNNISKDYINSNMYPVKATEYLLENVDLSKKKLFNSFNTGSYLEFKNIKTFMDSRSEIYESTYNNTTILKDFMDAYVTCKVDYKDFIKQYDFDILLVEKTFEMYKKIEEDEEKILNTLYEDDNFIIYSVK